MVVDIVALMEGSKVKGGGGIVCEEPLFSAAKNVDFAAGHLRRFVGPEDDAGDICPIEIGDDLVQAVVAVKINFITITRIIMQYFGL